MAPPPPTGADSPADQITIYKIQMSNLDLSQPGEASKYLTGTNVNDLDVGDILREAGPHKDERALSEHLRQLNRFLYKELSEARDRSEITKSMLTSIHSMLGQLMKEVKNMNDGGSKSPEDVQNEIAGVKSILHSQSRQQAAFHTAIKRHLEEGGLDEKLMADRSASLESIVKQHATFSSWMVALVVVAIVLFGVWFWRRIREMEKKHYL
eukprot:GHVO01018085.1.p2 GENE.GHVO01018085.1~~GHVO01018085.1.p2  ORF type:complete len:210 (+),score=48.57 GHVO01018085.1:735-1364(+)